MCLRVFSEVMFHCLRYELYEDILKQRYIKMLSLLHEFRNSLWFQKTIYILNKNSGLSFLCLIRKVSLNEKNFCEIWHLSRSEGTSLKYTESVWFERLIKRTEVFFSWTGFQLVVVNTT